MRIILFFFFLLGVSFSSFAQQLAGSSSLTSIKIEHSRKITSLSPQISCNISSYRTTTGNGFVTQKVSIRRPSQTSRQSLAAKVKILRKLEGISVAKQFNISKRE